jgi:hypothetical protein
MNLKLGKHPKKTDRRTLQLGRYLDTRKLPEPPVFVNHASRLPEDIGMMRNDAYGDCAVAAPGHMVQSWSVYADYPMHTISDDDIVAAYFTLSPNDEGCYMLDVMNYWRKTGIGGDKIEAFVETAPASITQAKLTIQLFGSLFIGMGLPNVNTFGPWNVKDPTWPANPSNGHAVCLLAYNDSTEMFKVATWGEVWDMSYGWFKKYVDESYACLNDLSLNALGLTPEGFNLAALQRDLAHIGDPILDPVPVPPPLPPIPPPDVERPDGPIMLTGVGGAYWTVVMDGTVQKDRHSQALEAVQHADVLRWQYPFATIEIRHEAVYQVD